MMKQQIISYIAGVSLGDDCTTVSMGFRSPTHRSMLTALCDFICQNTVPERLMYSDPSLKLQKSSGYIGSDAREAIRDDLKGHILKCLDNQDIFDYWLGRYLTIPLRMQLRKPRPFFLQSNARKSLRSLFVENGFGERMDSPVSIMGSDNVGGDESVTSILSGQSYEDDDDDFYEDDDEEEEPFFLRSPYRVASTKIFTDVDELLSAVHSSEVVLRRTEGTKFAFIDGAIFIDGEAFEFPSGMGCLGPLLCDRRVITKAEIEACGITLSGGVSVRTPQRMFLSTVIEAGYFYPCDINTV